MDILLVDDEPEFRESVKRILATEPKLRVSREAADGEEALRLAREFSFDIILMDIALPRLDGLEATRRIKVERPETKVIVLTVHGEAGYRRAAAECGADAYLLKKVARAELIPTIRGIAT